MLREVQTMESLRIGVVSWSCRGYREADAMHVIALLLVDSCFIPDIILLTRRSLQTSIKAFAVLFLREVAGVSLVY